MFTGIVEELGVSVGIEHDRNLSTLKVRMKSVHKDAKLGASIAINGACLTITKIQKNVVSFEVMKETLVKTTIGELKKDSKVNLERALKLGSRLDGHIVSGHVDGVMAVYEIKRLKNYCELIFTMKKDLAKFIAPKGSITIDGVSLTVGEVKRDWFSVYLIPVTEKDTTLGLLKKGSKVNIEVDLLARYVYNMRNAK